VKLKIEPRMLDKTTAAAYCGVTSATFAAVCPVKPHPPIGGAIRWDRNELDKWLDRRTQGKADRPSKAEILGRLDNVGAAQGN
jgi:hypothetical protein